MFVGAWTISLLHIVGRTPRGSWALCNGPVNIFTNTKNKLPRDLCGYDPKFDDTRENGCI